MPQLRFLLRAIVWWPCWRAKEKKKQQKKKPHSKQNLWFCFNAESHPTESGGKYRYTAIYRPTQHLNKFYLFFVVLQELYSDLVDQPQEGSCLFHICRCLSHYYNN